MDEENNVNVMQEVVSPEQETQPVSVGESEGQAQEHQEVETPEDVQEKNWREIRQTLKELRRENQALREQLTPRAQQEEAEEEEEGTEESLVTNKKLQKALSRIEQKLFEKERESVEDRVRVKFPDFDEVVTPENVEYLQKNDPELALSLRSLANDPFKQAMAAYKMLKRTDYYLNRNTMNDKAKIAENKQKPSSVQAVRKQGALSEANRFANGLTPELKSQLWKEMQESGKRA